MGDSKNKPLRRNLAILMATLAFGLYVNTIGHDYVMDDGAVISRNEFTKEGLAGIDDLVTGFYWDGFWTKNTGLYRPLTMVTYAIEWQFFPNQPEVAHFVNALLYALIGFLLFYFLSELLIGFGIHVPLIATLLFIVHPIHTEVVANIKSRDELLCFLFFLITARLLLKFMDHPNRKLLWRAVGTYALCLFSKESAVLFLPVFVLMVFFFRKTPVLQTAQRSWPLLISLGSFLFVRALVINSADSPPVDYTYQNNILFAAESPTEYLATALRINWEYFHLMVFPHPLRYDYSFNHIPVTNLADPLVWLALAVIIALAVIAWRGWKERLPEAFAILYFVCTFVIASNLLFPVGVTVAERMLFAPSLGLALAIAFLLHRFSIKDKEPVESLTGILKSAPVALGLTLLIAIPMSGKTIMRNNDWSDDLTLFETDLGKIPNSSRAHSNFAAIHMNTYALPKIDHAERSLLLDIPIKESLKALEIDPINTTALHNLSVAYYYTGQYALAKEHAERCVKHDPWNGQAYGFLGKALCRINDIPNAVPALQRALKLGYEDYSTYFFLGGCYFTQGDFSGALPYYERALEFKPLSTEAINKLASTYGNLGETQKALELFQRSYQLIPKDAYTSSAIAMCLQQLGDTAEAAKWFQQAQMLKTEAKN